jgi:hypothetical protein
MVKEVKMTAKELLETLIKEGLPPEGWGRWVWRASDGQYGVSSLVTSGTLPPVREGERLLFWWGGVRKADVPYWPEAFLEGLEPEDLEGKEAEEVAEKVLVGHLLAEVINELPDAEWEEFADALRGLRGLEAQTALELIR